jgi:branched-chain amino acid aminotransferase
MHRLLLHNDDIREAGDRFLSPGQVGLLNGWGVFSTLHVCEGVLFAWEHHWARMRQDAARMSVPFPPEAAWLEERLHRLVEANRAWNSTLRVVVVRNRGGTWEGPENPREFDVIAFTADLSAWNPAVKLGVVPNARHAAGEFAGTKCLAWAQNLIWYERAHQRGLDEVVLLNERGEVSECTSANVFVAEGGRAWTPPLASGCLPGVTRALLLDEIRVAGIAVSEKTLVPADLEAADEVFITSTTRGLLPVVSIEGLSLRRAGDVRRRLDEAFKTFVRSYVSARRRPVAAI